MHCPFNSIFYVGLWYSLAVAICAIAGRLVVPHLIRW
ncbi:MAG: NrsF family protein [Parasphingorhabdus sp.]